MADRTPDKARTVKLGAKLSDADALAAELRERFRRSGTFVLNLISAPGSGKTELVARTALRLKDELALGAIAGDLQTELDAERIARSGIAARAVETHGACHLRTSEVRDALEALPRDLDVLFIENVGNLVCPSSFDLGEDAKVALVSLPEGDDKPAKYPSIFSKAGAFVVTKTDLSSVCACDIARMRRDATALNARVAVFEVSARTGSGMDEWCEWLRAQAAAKRASPQRHGDSNRR